MQINTSKPWQCCTCHTAVTVPPLPPCPIHNPTEIDLDEPVEYRCLYMTYDGKMQVDVLCGVSASHAFDEAWHDCPGTVLAVQKID